MRRRGSAYAGWLAVKSTTSNFRDTCSRNVCGGGWVGRRRRRKEDYDFQDAALSAVLAARGTHEGRGGGVSAP